MRHALISGYLGKDPIQSKSGKGAILSVGADEYFMSERTTEWTTIILGGKPAEFALQQLKKGSFVVVRGSYQLKVNDYNGNQTAQMTILASDIQYPRTKVIEQKSTESEITFGDDDDIPF